MSPRPRYFATRQEFRAWLAAHHESAGELLVGFYKTGSGKPSLTWPESVDEALCYGWIDGVRRSLGAESYTIRFTPRRKGSIWSAKNVARARELIRAGVMAPPGLRTFKARDPGRTNRYSFEQKEATLGSAFENRFRANARAWKFFTSRPPSYRRPATWWVISAKREETRERRLGILIADSAAGRLIGPLRWTPRPRALSKPSAGSGSRRA
ncbi:MAG TPA: YdeI/OmpD-associated family protein [Bacteroidota bacterium]|nr:YdeI/OmpD-associated family protein [Bacteroidota bacterium]